MLDPARRPLVLVHCGWPRDRDLIDRLLHALGAIGLSLDEADDLRGLVADDRLDLILADSAGGHRALGALIRALDEQPGAGDLPMILLADASDVDLLADLASRRFNATLLTKPVEPAQLAASVRSGLLYTEARREKRRLVVELKAAHAESERRRAEAEAARLRYHDLVQGLDGIVWEADAGTGRITFVSRRAEEMLGYPVERWLGEAGPWPGLVHPEDRDYVADARRRGLLSGEDFDLEYQVVAADGRVVWLRESTRVALDASGRPESLRGLLWNITKRKKVERQLYKAKSALAERLDDMNHLNRLSLDLSAATGYEAILGEILGAVLGVFGAEMGMLRLLDRDRGKLSIEASEGLPEAYLERFALVPIGSTAGGRAVAEGRSVLIADLRAEPLDDALREELDLGVHRASASTPLVGRAGVPIGVVDALFREPHRPTGRQVRLVELYARQAVALVEAALLHLELRAADLR